MQKLQRAAAVFEFGNSGKGVGRLPVQRVCANARRCQNFISLAPPQTAGLTLFVLPPLPMQTLCVCAGTPISPVLKIGSRMVAPKEKFTEPGIMAYPGRCRWKYTPWPKRDPVKNGFQLPNKIFLPGLSLGALAVSHGEFYVPDDVTTPHNPAKTPGRKAEVPAVALRAFRLIPP